VHASVSIQTRSGLKIVQGEQTWLVLYSVFGFCICYVKFSLMVVNFSDCPRKQSAFSESGVVRGHCHDI